MATVFERVPVDRISVQARDIQFGRTVLTILAGVLFAAGWLAGKTLAVAWSGCAWCLAAVKVGWDDARRRPDGGG
jgi:hypothetical protein